jgi:signal transduction histidine kinase
MRSGEGGRRDREQPILLGSAEQLGKVSGLAMAALATTGVLGLAGTFLVVLSPDRPAGFHPLGVGAISAVAISVAILGRRRRSLFSPGNAVYTLPIATIALGVAAFLAGPDASPLVALFFVWFCCAIAFLPRRAAVAVMAWVGLVYAAVLVLQPGNYEPVARWGMSIGVMAGAATALDRMVQRAWALARGEQGARARAERDRTELGEMSAQRSRFLARMSHELRTPLNAVIGFSEVLERRSFGALNEKQAEYVTDVVDSGRHLLALVDDLLDLAKVETGRLELELGRVELGGLLSRSLGLFKEQAGRQHIALQLDVDPEVPTIEADARKLKQVVFNLLANAVRFTPAGGTVVLGAAPAGDRVRIWVSDTGPGIAGEEHEAIFEEFRQASGAVDGQGGTGLGLPLARRLVELHGGRLSVASEPGAGSTFTAELPARPRPEAAGTGLPAETAGERPERLVLGEPDSPERRAETARLITIVVGFAAALGVGGGLVRIFHPVDEIAGVREGLFVSLVALALAVLVASLVRPQWLGNPKAMPYVGALGIAGASVLVHALGPGPGDIAILFYGWVSVATSLVLPPRLWNIQVGLIGSAYAAVLILQDGHVAPLAHWVVLVGVSLMFGVLARRFVSRIEALALAERAARSEAEQVGAELEVASRHKTEFLANMSHELRTPLNAIIGFSEVLAGQAFGPLNEKQAEYVDDVLGSGRHLLGLINGILDLAKADAGRMELQVAHVDVEATLASVLVPYRADAARRRVDLTCEAALELGSIEADEAKLTQAVSHLVSNALKFTPDGGRVRLRANQDDDHLEITVTDSGRGVEFSDHERIFDAFAHGEDSSGTEQGSGLGLALARRYAELHGGSLAVASDPGTGATFTMRLPVRQADTEPATPAEVA